MIYIYISCYLEHSLDERETKREKKRRRKREKQRREREKLTIFFFDKLKLYIKVELI